MKKTFMLIIGSFLLPLIMAHSLYYFRSQIPIAAKHAGELLNPTIPLTLHLEKDLINHWNWILISPQPCDAICNHHKNLLENIHKTLGRHKKLVKLHNISSDEITFANNLELMNNSILLVDPRGHAILHYHAGVDKREVFKDMQHLIKVSKLTTNG